MKPTLSFPKLKEFVSRLGKYKYAILIALLGVILLLWPAAEPEAKEDSQAPPTVQSESALASELEAALAQIAGAGKTTLVLSWRDDGEVVYQTDATVSESDGAVSTETATVTVPSGSSQQQALVVQTRSPTCLGALVVCEGADSASVRLSIVSAVTALTGLGADQITVVKMKS